MLSGLLRVRFGFGGIMIPASREEQKKEAFRLFEDGRYQESLEVCTTILEGGKDSAVEVLAATNLFSTGRLEDAEVFFRDLTRKIPGIILRPQLYGKSA